MCQGLNSLHWKYSHPTFNKESLNINPYKKGWWPLLPSEKPWELNDLHPTYQLSDCPWALDIGNHLGGLKRSSCHQPTSTPFQPLKINDFAWKWCFQKLRPLSLPLPKTKSLPLKIGHPKRKRWSSNYHFLGGELLVSGRVCPLWKSFPIPGWNTAGMGLRCANTLDHWSNCTSLGNPRILWDFSGEDFFRAVEKNQKKRARENNWGSKNEMFDCLIFVSK